MERTEPAGGVAVRVEATVGHARRLTAKQRAWCERCLNATGMDPVGLGEFKRGGGPFREVVVQRTINWWERHLQDIRVALERF